MGYVISNHTCVLQTDPVCSFRIINGSILSVISILGLLLSAFEIYFLRSKIRLAACQNLFIMNVAVSDLLVSAVGIFRGLGIISEKFVGAQNNTANDFCILYAICVASLTNSGTLALLPLTIDRLVAVTFPLRHAYVITTKSSLSLIFLCWLPLVALLLYDTIEYKIGAIAIDFNERYHRCSLGRDSPIAHISALFVPFLLVLLMYIIMLVIIIKNKRRFGQFLAISSGIIVSSLLSYAPTIIAIAWSVPMSYEVSQILTVTLYYVNGIINPMVYFVAHPRTQQQSGILTLLPLTLDRLEAVVRPLHHRSVFTTRACIYLIAGSWVPALSLFLYNVIGYSVGSVQIQYQESYLRCTISGVHRNQLLITQVLFLFLPVLLVIIMYSIMFIIIIRKRRRVGRFLIMASGIILSSLISYLPSIIVNTWNVEMSYEVAQILTITLYYINGIVNPLIYFVAHPATRRQVRNLTVVLKLRRRLDDRVVVEPSTHHSSVHSSTLNDRVVVEPSTHHSSVHPLH
ncbi:hypothetical protein ACHWQZ_G006926 [Mnemiopsis leidyi]